MFNPDLITAIEGLSAFISQFHFKGCHLHEWQESDFAQFSFPELLHDHRGSRLIAGDLYVIVTCDNDYRYYINITCCSPLAACADVLSFLQYK